MLSVGHLGKQSLLAPRLHSFAIRPRTTCASIRSFPLLTSILKTNAFPSRGRSRCALFFWKVPRRTGDLACQLENFPKVPYNFRALPFESRTESGQSYSVAQRALGPLDSFVMSGTCGTCAGSSGVVFCLEIACMAGAEDTRECFNTFVKAIFSRCAPVDRCIRLLQGANITRLQTAEMSWMKDQPARSFSVGI